MARAHDGRVGAIRGARWPGVAVAGARVGVAVLARRARRRSTHRGGGGGVAVAGDRCVGAVRGARWPGVAVAGARTAVTVLTRRTRRPRTRPEPHPHMAMRGVVVAHKRTRRPAEAHVAGPHRTARVPAVPARAWRSVPVDPGAPRRARAAGVGPVRALDTQPPGVDVPPGGVATETQETGNRVAQLIEVSVGDVAAHQPEVRPRAGLVRRRRTHRPHAHRDGHPHQHQPNPPTPQHQTDPPTPQRPTPQRPAQHRHSAIQMPSWPRYTSASHEAREQSSSGMRLAA